MRVLHVLKVQGIGGAEQHLLTLLPALRDRGIDAQLLSLDAGVDSDRFHRALDELQIPWSRVTCGRDVSPRLALQVARVVRRLQPDLIHTHMVHGDIYGSIAAKLTRTRFVSSRHNDDRYLLGPFRFVDRTLMLGVRRIVAISDAVREFLAAAGLPGTKLVTVHYGLDDAPTRPSEWTPDAAGVPPSAPLLLAIGRLIEQKDHATLLRAFAEVHAARTEARLAILGWGPLETETKDLARELGLEDSVLVVGRVEPSEWLARADVFAHTSRWEGFGIVLLEAMLNELPIVATKVSAIPEIVDDGVTGTLVEAGDAHAVASAVLALLDDDALRATVGRAGLERARTEFSVAQMTDRMLHVYDAALA